MMSTVRMQLEKLASSLMKRLKVWKANCSHTFASRQIARIRRFLSDEIVKTLVYEFVKCRLDNCHYYTREKLIQKLQIVQNCAARLIMEGRKYDHITPILRELHWLPVNGRVIFKIVLFAYIHVALHLVAPLYIQDLLTITLWSTRNLRSSSSNLLAVSSFIPLIWRQMVIVRSQSALQN